MSTTSVKWLQIFNCQRYDSNIIWYLKGFKGRL